MDRPQADAEAVADAPAGEKTAAKGKPRKTKTAKAADKPAAKEKRRPKARTAAAA
jgi:hypothetical protein